jgi:hypothetical protein
MLWSLHGGKMLDALAAVVGLVWDLAVLALLWRLRNRGALFIVVAFALISLYTVDRMLPRILVDEWPNFDAASSPAMRPWFILPDLVLIGALLTRARFPLSRRALLIVITLGTATVAGLVMGATNDAIPFPSALFWATIPLKASLIVVLVDSTVRRDGANRAANQVVAGSVLGAGVLAGELLAVTSLQAVADFVGYDLASIWSGFDWIRPNLPGWNNNLAASAIAFGAAAAVLMPERTWLPRIVRWLIVTLCVVALLAAEYRTAIIALVIAIASRLGAAVFVRLRPHVGRLALVPAIGAAGLSAVVLLAGTAVVVPRLADINPVAYVTQGVSVLTPQEQEPVPADQSESSHSRALILQAALSVWQREPLTGPGLGAWEFDRPTEPTFLQKAITPHNGYAWALADLGLIGFAGFYVIPGVLVILRRPPLTLLLWTILLAVLEVSIAGIAHSRYAILYWAALTVVALAPWSAAEIDDPTKA